MGLKEDFNETKKELEELKEQSFAMEILQDYKKVNKRQFIIIIILIFALIGSIGYTIYLLNDISQVTTTDVQQENESGDNNYIGRDGDINGKTKSDN